MSVVVYICLYWFENFSKLYSILEVYYLFNAVFLNAVIYLVEGLSSMLVFIFYFAFEWSVNIIKFI